MARLAYQPIGREIVEGDVLVVRGVLQACLAWRGRILDVQTVTGHTPIRLLNAVDISPIGMWPADVRDSLLRFYADAQPEDPSPRLTVEVLDSPHYQQQIAKEAALSLLAIYEASCPNAPPDPPTWWSDGAIDR